jgi:hypothetical protein
MAPLSTQYNTQTHTNILSLSPPLSTHTYTHTQQMITRTWVGGLQLDYAPHKDTEMVVIKPVRVQTEL